MICVFVELSPEKKCRGNKCAFSQSYAEGSTLKGYEVEDVAWLGTENFEESVRVYMFLAVLLSFGCETEETGLIANQYADGMKYPFHFYLLPRPVDNRPFSKCVKE